MILGGRVMLMSEVPLKSLSSARQTHIIRAHRLLVEHRELDKSFEEGSHALVTEPGPTPRPEMVQDPLARFHRGEYLR